MTILRVDFSRLREDIEALAQIGRHADFGLHRMAFTEADMQARHWFQERAKAAGLNTYVDGACNVFARLNYDDDKPSVMTGSHIDTVPGAGHLDGALGAVAGLECLRCLKEQNIDLRQAVEVVAFSDEEGRFGDMLGSKAICGELTPQALHNSIDLEGNRLIDVMAEHGLNAMDALSARRTPESISSFVELHIEQGPVLDRRGVSLGIVDGIAGLFKWQVTFTGSANHAGTTPMNMRQDAFQGLAEFSSEIPRVLEENGSTHSVATIGRVELSPGAANVIPGKVDFSLEVRDTSEEVLEDLKNAFRRALSAIARRRGLMFEFNVLSQINPVKCDPGIMSLIEGVSRKMEIEAVKMPSGAAHDTQVMARITRAGMLFIPSKDGRSHSPAEWTPWEDIELGANVLLNTLYRLAK